MEAPLIVGIVFFSVVAVVKIIADNSTRRKLIERGDLDDRTRKALMGNPVCDTFTRVSTSRLTCGLAVILLCLTLPLRVTMNICLPLPA